MINRWSDQWEEESGEGAAVKSNEGAAVLVCETETETKQGRTNDEVEWRRGCEATAHGAIVSHQDNFECMARVAREREEYTLLRTREGQRPFIIFAARARPSRVFSLSNFRNGFDFCLVPSKKQL